MASSFAQECTPTKIKYDNCFNEWYTTKYLRGEGSLKDPCQELFSEYKACTEVQLKKRGLSKLLEEAKADEKGFDDFIPPPVRK